MKRSLILPALAGLGFFITILMVWHDRTSISPSAPAIPSARSPYSDQVAGVGLIEGWGGNIALSAPVPGIVQQIFVRCGDHVHRGQPLFQIDDRDLQARLLPAQAQVQQARAQLALAQQQLERAESISDQRAISREELDRRRLTVRIDAAALQTSLAAVSAIRMQRQIRTVRAMSDGQILRLQRYAGEYADSQHEVLILGDDHRRQVRVDIDQYDAARLRPSAPAMAFLRDHPHLHVALRFERIEPYVLAKTHLGGSSTERTDTRVLQVIYSFDPQDLPVYVGQQVDVFMQAGPL